MNVVEKLQQAISSKDWSYVSEVIVMLGGSAPAVEATEVVKKRGRPKKVKVPVQANKRINYFEQMEYDIDKPDGYEKVNDNTKRVPRVRKPYRPAVVTCSSCKEQREVHPSLVREYFVCDACAKVK